MGKLFGTDGIRGIAGQTLTAELAFHVGQAVAAVLTEEKGRAPLITIGKDTRISSDMLEAALMAGICSVGGDVMPLGTIPTPAVAFLTVQQQADAGIVISASHNPYAYNGIKVFNAQGYKLSDEMEGCVEDLILNHAELPAAVDGAVGRRHHGMHALHSAYVQHLLGSIDCDLTGLRVLVDCANGAASATAPDLFRALPLQADFIHTEPDGVNINNGCGSTHLESLTRGVVSGGYDLGIAFDGDADRCLLVDEQGNTIDGDKVKSCIRCKSCSIMSGFGGAGAFSDGKYNITNDFGGTLHEYIGKKQALDLMHYVDEINMAYGGEGTKLHRRHKVQKALHPE